MVSSVCTYHESIILLSGYHCGLESPLLRYVMSRLLVLNDYVTLVILALPLCYYCVLCDVLWTSWSQPLLWCVYLVAQILYTCHLISSPASPLLGNPQLAQLWSECRMCYLKVMKKSIKFPADSRDAHKVAVVVSATYSWLLVLIQ